MTRELVGGRGKRFHCGHFFIRPNTKITISWVGEGVRQEEYIADMM